MVVNNIPTKNWCAEPSSIVADNSGITNGQKVKDIIKLMFTNVIRKSFNEPKKFLLMYTVFLTLCYRLFETQKALRDFFAALYLASDVSSEERADLKYFQKFFRIAGGSFTITEIQNSIKDVAIRIKGVIRIPSIYDVTENGIEILWWIHKVSEDCTYLEKSPQECHDKYAQIEAEQDLFKNRIDKNLIMDVEVNPYNPYTYILSYYEKYEDYQQDNPLKEIQVKFEADGKIVIS
jgi:hypothetical protein